MSSLQINSIRYCIPDAEDLCQCPYDDTHMIRAKRMPYHLVKCRQKFKGLNFVNCPFNARHEMPAPELRHHIMNCPDRVMVSQDVTASKSVHKGNLTLPASTWEPTKTDEDWEKDAPRYPPVGLDKAAWMQKKIMAKSTIGMSRAEKRKFYEILRINYFREQEGLEPVDMDLQEDDQDAQLQELLQKQIMSLRMPLNKPQVLLNAEQRAKKQPPEPTPIFNQSLLLAGIGRGKAVVNPGVKLPRPESSTSWNTLAASMYGSSANYGTSETSDTGMSRLTSLKNSVEPAGRGIGRGLCGVGRGGQFPIILSPARLKPGTTAASCFSSVTSNTDRSEVKESQFEDVKKDTKVKGTNVEDDVRNDVDGAKDDVNSSKDDVNGGLNEEKLPTPKIEVDEDRDNVSKGLTDEEQTSALSDAEEDMQKLVRKFQKKLRGIEILEEKEKEGTKLNSEEMIKISKKPGIMKSLDKLQSQS